MSEYFKFSKGLNETLEDLLIYGIIEENETKDIRMIDRTFEYGSNH